MNQVNHIAERNNTLIATVYSECRNRVYGYILKHIGSVADAEDLTQDVFLRILEYTTPIDEVTVTNFTFSIAHNLIVDYLRHHAHKEAASDYFFIHSKRETNCTAEQVTASDLLRMERSCIAALPQRKQYIYIMCSQYGLSAKKVARTLNLSRRTVENHLFAARKQVREKFSLAI